MNRAMITTVLARLDGANLEGGTNWYDKGMEWATAKGINNSTNALENVSREQLITMIWRYYGAPAATGTLAGFSDAGAVSADATEAMRWAVDVGIVHGNGNGSLAPQSDVTRAEIAQLLQNLITNLNLPK